MGYRYLSPQDIQHIHLTLQLDCADVYRARPVNPDLLESAAYLPKQPYYRGFFMKAAALFRSIDKNHAFGDGNKRTAFMSLNIFLELNGYYLETTNEDAVEFTVAVADSRITDLNVIAEWIREHSMLRRAQHIQVDN